MNRNLIGALKQIRRVLALGILMLGAIFLGLFLLLFATAWVWFMAAAFSQGWKSVVVMSLVIVVQGGMWLFMIRHLAKLARMLLAFIKGCDSSPDTPPASWILSLTIVSMSCVPACAVFVMTPQQREAAMAALLVTLFVAGLLLALLTVPSNLIHKVIMEREKDGGAT